MSYSYQNTHFTMSTFTQQPNRRRRVMVFDVETTGLLPRSREGIPLTDLPHILQISFVIFDTQNWRVVKSVDLYINVDKSVEISPFITGLTGITRELCDKGVTITNAMCEFYKEYMLCDMIVAHNIKFDREMVLVEMSRHSVVLAECGCNSLASVFDKEFEKANNKELHCTMEMGRGACKIEVLSKAGKTYFKSPKLVELYEHLFGMVPMDLHNSLVDTYICLRCLVKMRFKFDLSLSMLPNIRFEPSKLVTTA